MHFKNKLLLLDSDSDSVEDAENEACKYYSVYENKYRQKPGHQNVGASRDMPYGQSLATVSVSVGQGVLSILSPVRVSLYPIVELKSYGCFLSKRPSFHTSYFYWFQDSQGNVIPGQQGEMLVQLDEGNMFLVSHYRGCPDLSYVCVQVNHATVFHNGNCVKILKQLPSSNAECFL